MTKVFQIKLATIKHGVMGSFALVMNGKIKAVGSISKVRLKDFIREAQVQLNKQP